MLEQLRANGQNQQIDSTFSQNSEPENDYGEVDGMAAYLKEITQYPLLIAEQEVNFAKAVESGRAAGVILESEIQLSDQEQRELENLVAKGKLAEESLINHNLRLVVSVAKKYMGRGLDILDMVQEGNLGLGRAVPKYDWRRGYRFSTYAYWWIWQAIGRAISDQSRTIRIPVHTHEKLQAIYNARRDLQSELNREPTDEEIGAIVNLEPVAVRALLDIRSTVLSLDSLIGNEEDRTLLGVIRDPSPGTEDLALLNVSSLELREVLIEVLSPREVAVLTRRFGLGEEGHQTLGEIGEELGVSRERVRQIEDEALIKLRNPQNSSRLEKLR